MMFCCCFFFQAEDGIRDLVRSRGLGDVYKRQVRYLLRLDIHSKDLRLKPQEKTNEPKEERINYVSTFTLKEAIRLISWLSKSEEYKSFISKIA